MSKSPYAQLLALLPILALAMAGCSSLDLPEAPKWPGSEDKVQIPNRMVDVWTDDILHQAGQPSKRGFGGRFMFYNNESEEPIKVDGRLTVYLFDDRCEDPLKEKPIHKFVFPIETFQKHYSKSDLGHSYSFWLPVDEVGGVEKRLTIIARFDPKVGAKVLSKPSTCVLPGRPADDSPTSPLVQRFQTRQYTKDANGAVRQVAYEEGVRGDPGVEQPVSSGLTTATINLSPDFTRQIGEAPSPSASGNLPATPGSTLVPGQTPVPTATPASVPIQMPLAPGFSRNSQGAAQPQVDSPLSKFQARREALNRRVSSRARMQPSRGAWPSARPWTPQGAWANESLATATTAQTLPPQWREEESW